MGLSVDVEIVFPSAPVENHTWKVGEQKISSWCDVAVFTTAREICGHREASGAFEQGLTLLITWMKAKTPGAME